jgi:hypothetical protein
MKVSVHFSFEVDTPEELANLMTTLGCKQEEVHVDAGVKVCFEIGKTYTDGYDEFTVLSKTPKMIRVRRGYGGFTKFLVRVNRDGVEYAGYYKVTANDMKV